VANHPIPLTPSGRRSLAATMARTAVPTVHPLVATNAIDTIDTVCGCILGALGCTPTEARSILAALWVYESTD
jgi:hypothetical protein